jgi:succinate dehydrogenase/fumarate reductase cytochrome b subunit
MVKGFGLAKEKRMNLGKVRTIHRRVGISIVCFLLVQAIAGILMSIGRLASIDTSKLYNVLYSIHADWDPLGSIYRVILGFATAMQGILGIMIFLSRFRFRTGDKAISSIPTSPDQSHEPKKEVSMGAPSFAADIRPLFREKDIAAMKPKGVDLSSYEGVKNRAQDIYARLSAKEMPCDGSWSAEDMKRFKEWMESGMVP